MAILVELFNALGAVERERRAIRPIFDLPDVKVSDEASEFEHRSDLVRCRIVSHVGMNHCPFEVVFGRHKGVPRFSLFLGRGARHHDFEELAEDECDDIAGDLDIFIRSRVSYETHLTRGEVVREDYVLSGFESVNGVGIKFTYRSRYPWPIIRSDKRQGIYQPWVS